MFCNNCGNKLDDGAVFCGNCGCKVDSNDIPVNTADNFSENNVVDTNTQNPPKASTFKKQYLYIVISVLAVIVVAIIFFSLKGMLGNKNTVQNEVEPPVSTEETLIDDYSSDENKSNLSVIIDEYIDDNISQEDISVAVIDNISGYKYYSENSQDKYTAWGFYLPIYLAYGDNITFNDSIAKSVMSKDVGLCNINANKAIDELGGLTTLNDYLVDTYNVYVTHYGRYFAEVNAADDNYTSAFEAVEFLKRLNEDRDFDLLSNSINDFGVIAPADATVYAHMGSENRAVRNNLNMFAIVKGENSDYCVAILSRNGVADEVSGLLYTIHEEMERVHE